LPLHHSPCLLLIVYRTFCMRLPLEGTSLKLLVWHLLLLLFATIHQYRHCTISGNVPFLLRSSILNPPSASSSFSCGDPGESGCDPALKSHYRKQQFPYCATTRNGRFVECIEHSANTNLLSAKSSRQKPFR
jgi:hypothetical protein